MRLCVLLAIAVVGACGDDPPPPPAKKPAGGGGGPRPRAEKVAQLQPRMHVENRVYCPPPAAPSGPACAPDAPSCDAGLYCLKVGDKHHCEPCPERYSIRHEFKDRDFVADQARDPFQSFIIVQRGLEAPAEKKPGEGSPCTRREQFVATNFSYMDLRLVGIVAQGTQRKVLMMDRVNVGHIIRRGDCVGKEKAFVKDIGTGFVTFVIAPNEDDQSGKPPVERSVQLHPKALAATAQPDPAEPTSPTAPVVAPPVVAPPATP